MPETRSKTGKLPAKRTADEAELTAELNVQSSESLQIEGYHAETDRKVVKRAKKSRTEAGVAKATVTRQKGKLSALPSMAMDILFEIFSHLAPGDLLALSRVTKSFRAVLMDKNTSAFLWKRVFENVPGAPPCPDDMAPPVWANLLFGGSYCHSCGAKRVLKVDFMLRLRACNACFGRLCTSEGDFFERLQDIHDRSRVPFSDELFDTVGKLPDLLPHTRRASKPKRHWRPWTKFWLNVDVVWLCSRMEDVFLGGEKDEKEAKEEVMKLRSELQKSLNRRAKHAKLALKWTLDTLMQKETEREEKKRKRFNDILARITPLGYVKQDLEEISGHRDVNSDKSLTNRVWERVFSSIKPELEEAKRLRLEVEKQRRKGNRKEILVQEYLRWLRMQHPRDCTYMPSLLKIEKLPEIVGIIDEDGQDSTEFRSRLRSILSDKTPAYAAQLNERVQLAAFLVPEIMAEQDQHASSKTSSTTTLAEAKTYPEGDQPASPTIPLISIPAQLTRARAIFTCSDPGCKGRILFSEEAIAHANDCSEAINYDTSKLAFSERGSLVVTHLLELLGMGSTATTLDLDRRDARFICKTCPWRECYGGGRDKFSFTWRECVEHMLTNHKEVVHDQPDWQLIPEAEAEEIRRSDFVGYESEEYSWGCGTCTAHIQSAYRWSDHAWVISHLKDTHGIQDPHEGDYFMNPRIQRRTYTLGCFRMSDP